MKDFITSETTLDPDAIRGRGFAARIFPEFPSEEEIALISDLIGATEIEFWAHEFGLPSQHFAAQPVGLMFEKLFENAPYGLLIHFLGRNLFIWAPEDHEFLVVFGNPDMVHNVEQSGVFSYKFADYLESGDLSNKTVKHLEQMMETYTIC